MENKENTNEEECNCKEMSCQKGCARNHTHKGFFCEICEPEACKKMREPAKVIPPEEKLSLKHQISQILVKWEMPTRQVAINEILELFSSHNARLIEMLSDIKSSIYGDGEILKLTTRVKYAHKLDDIIKIIKESNLQE